MKFEYYDAEQDWLYMIDFNGEHFKSPLQGFVLEVKTNMKRMDGTVGLVLIHRDYVNIDNGHIHWAKYHTRKDDPLTSESFRRFAQKLINNKAFM